VGTRCNFCLDVSEFISLKILNLLEEEFHEKLEDAIETGPNCER
jgi:hypothetical protein